METGLGTSGAPLDRFLRARFLFGIAALFAVLAFPALLGGGGLGPVHPGVAGSSVRVLSTPSSVAPTTAPPVTSTVSVASGGGPPVQLSISTSPTSLCVESVPSCPAHATETRVTLAASAATAPITSWPDVQVAFVVETTSYDGVYYHYYSVPGLDKCAEGNSGQGVPCEESNMVPFFMGHAQQIANSIVASNPHSNVSFALVDFFATDAGDWSDGVADGTKYHVDIPQFIPAPEFGGAVVQTLQDGVFGGQYAGFVGLDDNFLDSPSITALYGALIGSGLDWSPNTHHVLVLMGSTAPRDPHYVQDYLVSSSFYNAFSYPQYQDGPNSWTCEPAYSFGDGVSPNCEGWVVPQDGNPNDSIAALAHHSPTCVDSVGSVCTIDTIDVWDTPTDPLSAGWPTSAIGIGGGPGGPAVQQDSARILEAGCDLAAATGGTWDGPSFAACPNGQAGDLVYMPHGPIFTPNDENPSLLRALGRIGFGPVTNDLVANGTSQPMFRFVPFGAMAVAPQPQFAASCSTAAGFLPSCQTVPTAIVVAGHPMWGWNFSTHPALNQLHVGDRWTAAFNMVATGPPFGEVPVDACVTLNCRVAGSGAVDGWYTSATLSPQVGGRTGAIQSYSFPVAQVWVDYGLPSVGSPTLPPAPPAAPGAAPIVVGPLVPVAAPASVLANVGVANVSLQATAAGFLGAGFVRVSLKNRPIALRVAAKAGPVRSKFDSHSGPEGGPGVGRFE
ncbi:MAG: hypothetical protein L3K19_09505 [Thermoplasmata archaeon]|nr:hypothetical protein [Thermoplasmata archaeon]